VAHKAGLFDLRLVIAVLFGIFGVVLLVVGLGFTDDADLSKADGLNINLWSGVGMIVLSAVFGAWALLRPVMVPEPAEGSGTASGATAAGAGGTGAGGQRGE
jgi:drug/metabolite transporter (DMT)-like permease